MRIAVECQVDRQVQLPVNHQYHLTALTYRLLASADEKYAGFLHNNGYAMSGGADDRKRFKLFTFSWLRGPSYRVDGDSLYMGPGRIEWQVSSPVTEFLEGFAEGLLTQGFIQIDRSVLPISQVTVLAEPQLGPVQAYRCLSPIAVAVADERDGRSGTHYLRHDDPRMSECVRRNLVNKHVALTGSAPADEGLEIVFDPVYAARRNPSKLIHYKDIEVRAVLCPFTLACSQELQYVAYACGVGQGNSAGFGMIEAAGRPHR